jgi:uncharacterized protein (TIGR03437 family)
MDSFLFEQFTGGNGGAIQIGSGIGPFPGISVSLQATTPAVNSSVYLSPVGVENSASYAPFTAGISHGEYITLTGSNLGPSSLEVAPGAPFPTKLGNVQVMINNIPAPIYYVSANQLAVIVPNEISEINSSIAQIQVINNGNSSNVVTEFVNETNPGVFSQTENGIGYGAIEHSDGSLVTPDSPAQIGETVSAFITGLGDVFPTLLDGVAAPTNTTTNTSNPITADISGTMATVTFSGLAPGFVSLYQVNVTIPSGVTTGDNFLDIGGPDSYNSEALISVGDSSAAVQGPHLHPRPHPRKHIRVLPKAARVPTTE